MVGCVVCFNQTAERKSALCVHRKFLPLARQSLHFPDWEYWEGRRVDLPRTSLGETSLNRSVSSVSMFRT
jgi:hypothetical protein